MNGLYVKSSPKFTSGANCGSHNMEVPLPSAETLIIEWSLFFTSKWIISLCFPAELSSAEMVNSYWASGNNSNSLGVSLIWKVVFSF